jgi:hypothetical protein
VCNGHEEPVWVAPYLRGCPRCGVRPPQSASEASEGVSRTKPENTA